MAALGPAPNTAPAPETTDPEEAARLALAAASARAAALDGEAEEAALARADARSARDGRILIGLGKTLITIGLLILGFVAYELLGTNLAESRHQSDLKAQLRTTLQSGGSLTPPDIDASLPNGVAAPPAAPSGSAVAVIKIPRIGVEKAVVEGVTLPDLKRGPGHYPGTPLPGQPGNAAIAGHRTTYGSPFFRLDEMKPGDPIFVSTAQGAFRYEVKEVKVVKPTDVEVVRATDDARLTLTTCNPRFSARERLTVVAMLQGPAAQAAPRKPITPQEFVENPPQLDEQIAEVVGATSDPRGRVPAIGFGLATALVGGVAIGLSRRFGRVRAWVLLGVPFGICLFVFYQNLARVIPS